MDFFDRLRTLDRLHALIYRKGTGTPATLASRLCVSRRTVYHLIDDLRSLGADISYCRSRQSFYYQNSIEFCFDLVIETKQEEQIVGGESLMDCRLINNAYDTAPDNTISSWNNIFSRLKNRDFSYFFSSI